MDTKIFMLGGILFSGLFLGLVIDNLVDIHEKDDDDVSQHVQYVGMVQVYKNGILIDRQENLLVDQGKNFTMEVMSGIDQTGAVPGTDYAKYISLTDAYNESSSDTVLSGEITTGGLERATGTCAANQVGNWSCVNTFSVTASFTGVNGTGLNWNSSQSATTLVAESVFTDTNLESGDSLKINWTIGVS